VALVADADRIVQALTNLIANAVKYTSAGGRVWLTATADAHEVRLEVGDTGRGIPAEQLAAIFEKFQQVAPDEAREKGGAGLGLAITRAIVERHGGRVWTESEVGVGSRFFLALPRSGPEEPGGTP
jgi:signal transduction histidine kinase